MREAVGSASFYGGVMRVMYAFTAAAVVVGMGSAADAASLRYDIRYEGSFLENALIIDAETEEELWFGDLNIDGAPWELPTLYSNAKKGDLFEAYVETEEGDDERGLAAPVCWVGGFNCRNLQPFRYVDPNLFNVVADQFAVWETAGVLTVTSWGEYDGDGFRFSGDGYQGSADAITATFTIVELAPVPLPASVALLPLGIGALAMMRRRRRSI